MKEGLFTEFWRILEEPDATALATGDRLGVSFPLQRRRWCFRQTGFMSFEPGFKDDNGGTEVVAERQEQVDVVEVFLAAEAVGEVVAWVDGGEHFAAVGAEEAEVAVAPFCGWPVAAEGGDGDGHGQMVANSAE